MTDNRWLIIKVIAIAVIIESSHMAKSCICKVSLMLHSLMAACFHLDMLRVLLYK